MVDFLVRDREPADAIIIEFVPDPKIYNGGRTEQLESAFIDPTSLTGRHVLQLLGRLGEVLGLPAPPVRIGHGGGDDFDLYDADDQHTRLPAACHGLGFAVTVQVYAVLQLLDQEAQLEFLDKRRRALVAAAG